MNKEFICEQCGEKVNGTEYHEEHLTIEQHYECLHCGFRRHWVYGYKMPDDSEYEEGKETDNEMNSIV